MSFFWYRLLWRIKGRKSVRLHLTTDHSIEGVLVGVLKGHYVLLNAKLMATATDVTPMEGWVEVPKEKVIFYQVLS